MDIGLCPTSMRYRSVCRRRRAFLSSLHRRQDFQCVTGGQFCSFPQGGGQKITVQSRGDTGFLQTDLSQHISYSHPSAFTALTVKDYDHPSTRSEEHTSE